MKADCVYRLGVCFQRLGKKRKAETCYREYLNLLATGVDGMYSIADVQRQLQKVHGAGNGSADKFRKSLQTSLRAVGIVAKRSRSGPPVIKLRKLVADPAR